LQGDKGKLEILRKGQFTFQKAQLVVSLILLRSIQKTKSLSPFFGVRFVMHVVSVHNAFHVLTFGRKFKFQPAMYYQIMENKIEKSVKCDAQADVEKIPIFVV
jgi:hypothetical protein